MSGRRERISEQFVAQSTKVGAIGVLAALLGTTQALGWIHVEPHRASEMGWPTIAGASLAALLAIAGLAIAPSSTRARLRLTALVGIGGGLVLAAWGGWLLRVVG